MNPVQFTLVAQPKFGALYQTFMDAKDLAQVKEKLATNEQFTRRDDENDWVYQGGPLPELMGLDTFDAFMSAGATNFSETVAEVRLNESKNMMTIQTDHPETARIRDKAVVLRGVIPALFDSETVGKVREQWNNHSREWLTRFYLGDIPAGLPDDLKVDPNKMIGHFPAIFRAIYDEDLELFSMLIRHPQIEPHKEHTSGWTPLNDNSEVTPVRLEMFKTLIAHHKTTIADLEHTHEGCTTMRDKRKGDNKTLNQLIVDKIKELGGTV